MASPVAIAIESASADRAGLGSSFGGQRSYGTVKESTITASGRLCGYTVHTVLDEDTLQGLAVKYGVTIHHIQRLNNLWDSESIHSRADLKIPTSSFTPSPQLKPKRLHPRMASSLQDIHQLEDGEREQEAKRKPPSRMKHIHQLEDGEREQEAKRKPPSRMKHISPEPFQEKSIESLLMAADVRIAEMHKFNEKLALKTAHLKRSADSYNRPHPQPRISLSPSVSNHSETSSSAQSSMEVVVEMGRMSKKDEERRRRLAKESSESLSISRDTIEDHIFEL